MNYDDRYFISAINCNIAHTCGNICSVITQYFKSKFSKDFFTNTHLTTEIAIKQFKKIGTLTDFHWKKPYLIIQPKLLIGDPTEAHIDIWRRIYGTSMYDLARMDDVTSKFFYDEANQIILDYGVERAKMSFQFTVVLSTEYQQYNISSHMVNELRPGRPYYVPDVKLETVLPEFLLSKISKDSGIPILDEKKSPTKFLNYLNSVSRIPITLEFQPATGYYRFRLVVLTSILLQFESGLDIGDGNGDGMTKDEFPLVINANMEFNYPAKFFYVSEKEDTSVDTTILEEDGSFGMSTSNTFFHTFQKIIIPEEREGKLIDKSIAFITENEVLDTIEFKPMMENYYFGILDELKKKDVPYDTFVYVEVYENEKIKEKEFYEVDLDNCILNIRDTKTYHTYRIVVYLDNVLVNKYKLGDYKYQ